MEQIGSYLGRKITIVDPEEAKLLNSAEIMSDALVLVWMQDDSDQSVQLLESVSEFHPPAMLVCGPGAKKGFDVILNCLSLNPTAPHTMTSMSDESPVDCVQQLLQGTWPSEDRFDEWRGYTLVAPKTNAHELRSAAIRFSDE